MKPLTTFFIVLFTFLFSIFSSPSVQGVSNNIIQNGGLELGNANGWKFSHINRQIYPDTTYPGSYEGHYWLDTSRPCPACPSDFGGADNTLAYDINEKTVIGQRYQASVHFRSPQKGRVKFG